MSWTSTSRAPSGVVRLERAHGDVKRTAGRVQHRQRVAGIRWEALAPDLAREVRASRPARPAVGDAQPDRVQPLVLQHPVEECPRSASPDVVADEVDQRLLHRRRDQARADVEVADEPAQHQRIRERHRDVGKHADGDQQRDEESQRQSHVISSGRGRGQPRRSGTIRSTDGGAGAQPAAQGRFDRAAARVESVPGRNPPDLFGRAPIAPGHPGGKNGRGGPRPEPLSSFDPCVAQPAQPYCADGLGHDSIAQYQLRRKCGATERTRLGDGRHGSASGLCAASGLRTLASSRSGAQIALEALQRRAPASWPARRESRPPPAAAPSSSTSLPGGGQVDVDGPLVVAAALAAHVDPAFPACRAGCSTSRGGWTSCARAATRSVPARRESRTAPTAGRR